MLFDSLIIVKNTSFIWPKNPQILMQKKMYTVFFIDKTMNFQIICTKKSFRYLSISLISTFQPTVVNSGTCQVKPGTCQVKPGTSQVKTGTCQVKLETCQEHIRSSQQHVRSSQQHVGQSQ